MQEQGWLGYQQHLQTGLELKAIETVAGDSKSSAALPPNGHSWPRGFLRDPSSAKQRRHAGLRSTAASSV
jgi:hypothetical protein